MKQEIFNTLRIVIALAVGIAAGHFHGKAQVYEAYMQGGVNVLERLK